MGQDVNYGAAVNALLAYNKLNKTDLAIMLDISPSAVSQKASKNAFTNRDIDRINKHFKVNLAEVARRLAKEEPPMDVVAEEMAHYGRPADFTITLNAEETKQIMLNLSKTNAQLIEEMADLRAKMQDFINRSS